MKNDPKCQWDKASLPRCNQGSSEQPFIFHLTSIFLFVLPALGASARPRHRFVKGMAKKKPFL